MLKKSLKGKPESIGEEVLKSGLGEEVERVPLGMKWKFLDRKSGKPFI